MAKGFKVLISQIISSFQFCRSKNPSNFPENHVPSFLQLSPNPVFIHCPPATQPLSNPTAPPSSTTCPPSSHPSAVCSAHSTPLKTTSPNHRHSSGTRRRITKATRG
ncbi:hypothetical protein CsSME_00028047 [Camellia sinensis var. sinensis]